MQLDDKTKFLGKKWVWHVHMYPSVLKESYYLYTCWRHREYSNDEETTDKQSYIYNFTYAATYALNKQQLVQCYFSEYEALC